jgi:hypothetical protein
VFDHVSVHTWLLLGCLGFVGTASTAAAAAAAAAAAEAVAEKEQVFSAAVDAAHVVAQVLVCGRSAIDILFRAGKSQKEKAAQTIHFIAFIACFAFIAFFAFMDFMARLGLKFSHQSCLAASGPFLVVFIPSSNETFAKATSSCPNPNPVFHRQSKAVEKKMGFRHARHWLYKPCAQYASNIMM